MTETTSTPRRHDAMVATDRPQRWAKQLAAHLGRRMQVEETGRGPLLTMTFGEQGGATCLLDITAADVLGMHVESDRPEAAERMMHVVGGHLERFGEKEGLTVSWTAG